MPATYLESPTTSMDVIWSMKHGWTKALERRGHGLDGYHGFPDQETLKGTLRACQEQTSGFMWELVLIAVETRLKDVGYTRLF